MINSEAASDFDRRNLDWYIDNLGAAHHEKNDDGRTDLFRRLEVAVGKAPAGAGGVLFHPYLFGERAPFVNPHARAAFFGIQSTTTNDHLLRAIYEGIALSARDCYKKVEQPLSEITLVGGGARSRVWCQTLADVLGCKMMVPRGSQFGALGAAIAGGVGSDCFRITPRGWTNACTSSTSLNPLPHINGAMMTCIDSIPIWLNACRTTGRKAVPC